MLGSKKGLTPLVPMLWKRRNASRKLSEPLMADPMRHAVRGPTTPSMAILAWARASWHTTMVSST
jgi:hypothetical protein